MRVEVEDDGPGMAPEVRERLFEPFFTTSKDPRRGFGLATIHGLVATFGGTIDVESAPGAGTTVRIRLPRA